MVIYFYLYGNTYLLHAHMCLDAVWVAVIVSLPPILVLPNRNLIRNFVHHMHPGPLARQYEELASTCPPLERPGDSAHVQQSTTRNSRV